MNVSVQEHRALNNQIFYVAKFTILKLLSLVFYVDSHSQLLVGKYSLSPLLHKNLLIEFSYST